VAIFNIILREYLGFNTLKNIQIKYERFAVIVLQLAGRKLIFSFSKNIVPKRLFVFDTAF